MIASPGSMRSARAFTTSSVISPAGTITQAARGLLSLATNSSRSAVPIAPSPDSYFTGSGLRS